MKTIKILYSVAGMSLLLSTSSVFASLGTGTLTITAPGLSSGNANGPYNVVSTPGSGPDLGNFQTFCLAYTVDYYNGGKYDYNISTAVEPQAGNHGGTGLGYVSVGTAWLYGQFLAGNASLSGKNDAIQEVIWYLQGQSAPTSASGYSDVLALVNSAVGLTVGDDNNGQNGIYALNLIIGSGAGYASAAPGDAGGYAQPQLCYIPPNNPNTPPSTAVPEPSTVAAGALILLPLAVSSIRILRRNKPAKTS
jgi:hypothetical protein